jgi:hypothetical protein
MGSAVTDRAARPSADGRVVLEPQAVPPLLGAVEMALRSYRKNGKPVNRAMRDAAAALAFSAPWLAVQLPAVLAALGPDAAAGIHCQAAKRQVRRLGVAAFDAGGSQPPESGPAVPLSNAASALLVTGPLTAGQAARMTGLTTHGVRTACRRGTLDARKNRVTGEWLIEPDALRHWEAGKHAA